MQYYYHRQATNNITKILILVNFIMYVITSIMSKNFLVMDYEVLAYLGQYNLLVLSGWYWQLLTSMFIHVNLVHFMGNMLFLLIYGSRGEEFFSKIEFIIIYFLSGFAGNMLSLLGGPNMVSAGASGALFGLFGANVIYAHSSMKESIGGALIYSLFMFIFTMGANVNLFAHFGGLIVGLLIGYIISKTRPIIK
jgi:rhomboid protease GluP